MAPSKRPSRPVVDDDDDDEATTTDIATFGRNAEEAEDDDDTVTVRPGRVPSGAGEGRIRGGWTESDKQDAMSSTFAQSLKLEESAVFLKFLEDTPYAAFRRHWVERSTKEGKQLRAWTCLGSIDKDCPLCEVGDRAQAVSAFNVALIGDDGQVIIKSWDVGPRLKATLKGYANDPRVGPLTKGYFMANKTGKRGTVQHNVNPVSKSSLIDDYGIEPPLQEELDRLKRYDPSIIQIPSVRDLRELAQEISDEY